jgi:hypothetical protein
MTVVSFSRISLFSGFGNAARRLQQPTPSLADLPPRDA